MLTCWTLSPAGGVRQTATYGLAIAKMRSCGWGSPFVEFAKGHAMFSFFKKKQPKKPETFGQELNFTFQNEEGSWEESIHLLDLLEQVMEEKGRSLQRQDESLIDQETRFEVSPEFLTFDHGENGVQTCSIITVSHPELVPAGLFEYQHSAGTDTAESVRSGFDTWYQTDFVPLREATLASPDECMTLVIESSDGRKRLIIWGPVAHYAEQQETYEAASACSADGDSDEHPFCPCCMFTRSVEAFQWLVESSDFYGLRMYAMRDENGRAQSDCRINGHDDKKGMAALRRYVTTWPQAGFEFRKQYVVVQTT